MVGHPPSQPSREPLDEIQIDMRKWPNRLHWQYRARRLGEDEHGVWAYVAPGTEARRGDDPPAPLPAGFMLLIPTNRWWVIEFYRHHAWCEIYVNIGTPPVWEATTVRQVDLDLDVVLKVDGTIAVLDEDEFNEHQILYSYPTRIIKEASRAAAAATAVLQRRSEPIASVAAAWWVLADV